MQRDPNIVIIDHISLGVSDLERSGAFYDAALAPLGITRRSTASGEISYARNGIDDFSIHPEDGAPVSMVAHFAFLAPDRSAVDAFHAAGVAHGGQDDGAPGLRPRYHPNYYAAFVLDPDGHRIEAVCHAAKSEG